MIAFTPREVIRLMVNLLFMTLDDKARFLDAAPHLLDYIQAIQQALGRDPLLDWNDVCGCIKKLLGEVTT